MVEYSQVPMLTCTLSLGLEAGNYEPPGIVAGIAALFNSFDYFLHSTQGIPCVFVFPSYCDTIRQ